MRETLLLLLLACATAGAWGEPVYVSDQLSVMLRAGESTKYKILRTLKSGTPLEVLGVSESSGYARVQTEDGLSGYVLERLLQNEPAAREQVASLQARLQELQQAPDQLAANLAALQADHQALTQRFGEVDRRRQAVEQELAELKRASADVVRIAEERDALSSDSARLKRQVADLQQANLELTNQTAQRWFMIGAGVIVGGILIGLILPHLRMRRRKNSWGSL